MNNHGYCVWRHSNTGGFNSFFVQVEIQKLHYAVASGQLNQKQFNESVQNIVKKGWKKTPGQKLGVLDIVGFNLRTGKFTAVELKLDQDTLSTDQKDFIKIVESAGAEKYIVKDFPVFSAYLRGKTIL